VRHGEPAVGVEVQSVWPVFWVKRPESVLLDPGPAILPKVVTLVAVIVLALGAWILMQPGDARHDPESAVATASASGGDLP
jgi:hypothetical protein